MEEIDAKAPAKSGASAAGSGSTVVADSRLRQQVLWLTVRALATSSSIADVLGTAQQSAPTPNDIAAVTQRIAQRSTGTATSAVATAAAESAAAPAAK